MSDSHAAQVAVRAKPFLDEITKEGCTELVVNGDGSAFVELSGQWQPVHHVAAKRLVEPFLATLASFASASLNSKSPLLSASLPTGERVQIVCPPVVPDFAISIRKPSTLNLDFAAYAEQGAFLFTAKQTQNQEGSKGGCSIKAALNEGDVQAAITQMIVERKTLVISGGTSSGKTTFFNAAAKLIPNHERLITIEDTREINLLQENVLHLVAQRNNQSATFNSLLEACLRLRPDRILAAELRGPTEALAFLEGANTGHPGSMTTLHSNSTNHTVDRLIMMLMRANIGLAREHISQYVHSIVDGFIHFDRARDGSRSIREIRYQNELYRKDV
jgi:type IV secretion system protein VirB11